MRIIVSVLQSSSGNNIFNFELLARFLLTCIVSLPLGFILKHLKIPCGMMAGAMVGAMLFNLITGGMAYMPHAVKLLSQAIAGMYIGCSIGRKDLRYFSHLWKPVCILILCMTFTTIFAAWLITLTSPIDSLSALLASMPSGVTEAPVIATQMGGDATKVAILHIIRLITGVGFYPLFIQALTGRNNAEYQPHDVPADANQKKDARRSPLKFALTLILAIVSAQIGALVAFPASPLIFSMIATGILSLVTDIGTVSGSLKHGMQPLVGAYIGCMIGCEDLLQLYYLIIPALILIVLFALNCFLSGWLLTRYCSFDSREALLASIPAGASEMAFIASDMNIQGRNVDKIVLMHIMRTIIMLSLIPQIIPLISRLF